MIIYKERRTHKSVSVFLLYYNRLLYYIIRKVQNDSLVCLNALVILL